MDNKGTISVFVVSSNSKYQRQPNKKGQISMNLAEVSEKNLHYICCSIFNRLNFKFFFLCEKENIKLNTNLLE
jgi:hypothetical protein